MKCLASPLASALATLAVAALSTGSEPRLREAWVGKLDLGLMQPVLQLRVLEDDSGATRARFDSITERRTDFEAVWSIEDGVLRFEVPSIRATYSGELDAAGTTAVGRFAQGGRDFALTLRRQDAAYEEVHTWENRPQRPRPPFPYRAEEVVFENRADGVRLAGTLTLPAGNGPHPAVVLVSGSGPQDRDETLMEHKPFLVLADHLSRRGIAVLRYDDRGTAGSSGDFAAALTEDFARDAEAGLDFLRAHAAIDPARIGIVGHSEGGLVAPLVAAAREEVALIALLAAPGVLGRELAVAQSESIARAEGADEATLEASAKVLEVLLQAVESARDGDDVQARLREAMRTAVEALPDEQRELVRAERNLFTVMLPTYASPWFRAILRHDPAPILREVRCPVLALNGEKDVQVLPRQNLPAIRRALTEGGNPDFEVVELPGLNHMLQRCEGGAVSEYVSIAQTLDPAALELLGGWLERRLRAGPR